MSNLPTLLLPVEIKVRELKSRLYFAARATERGFPVLIGPSRPLHHQPDAFPLGVIIDNDVTPASAAYAAKARALGFRLAAWDEEAIAVLNDDWYVRQRIDPAALARFDLFFTRGQGDGAAIAARYPHLAERLVSAGNPRLDILDPQVAGVHRAAAPDGPIVVMSRFSRSNPFSISREKVLENVKRKFRFNVEDAAFYEGYLEHCHALFDRFLPMVGRMAERFPEREIVVRPHPSENFATWQELAGAHGNLVVRAEGTAEEWAARASLVVHNGCTTGLEAALVGVPVLSFMPLISQHFDVPLPNEVSDRCPDEESLFAAVSIVLTSQYNPVALACKARRALEGRVGDGSGRLASEIILARLAEVYAGGLPAYQGRGRALAAVKLARLKHRIKGMLTNTEKAGEALGGAYRDQKFPPTTTGELDKLLTEFGFGYLRDRAVQHGWWRIEKRP